MIHKFASVSNLFIKMMCFNGTGDKMKGHSHTYDHLTLLTNGKLRVTIEGEVSEYEAPHMIYITKDKAHDLEALSDDTVAWCIHALRDIDGNLLEPDMIPKIKGAAESISAISNAIQPIQPKT